MYGQYKDDIGRLVLDNGCGDAAAASDELTMVAGTYTDQSTSDGMYVYRFNQRTGNRNWWAMCRLAILRFS